MNRLTLPALGSTVYVIPVGADETPEQWWPAVLLTYLPDGRMRVRSARYPDGHAQTVTNVAVERPEISERANKLVPYLTEVVRDATAGAVFHPVGRPSVDSFEVVVSGLSMTVKITAEVER